MKIKFIWLFLIKPEQQFETIIINGNSIHSCLSDIVIQSMYIVVCSLPILTHFEDILDNQEE
jgi:hypothetical protein